MNSSSTVRFGVIVVATLSVFVGGCGGGAPAPTESSQAESQALAPSQAQLPPFNFEIRTLSNRADLISDGDALVEVQVPKNVPMHQVTLKLNGANVDAAFVANADARTLRGVLRGLVVGENHFVADANGQGKGRPKADLTITNHPRGGPVLLGSQTTPWICATPTPVPESGNTPASNASGLTTAAFDAQCNILTEYKLFYRTKVAGCSTGLPDPIPPPAPRVPPLPPNCFQPYDVSHPPANDDIATAATGGPYIVRVERGTMNRGIYDIAVLFDPTRAQPQWNGKVVYTFGASTGQPRLQFRSEQNWADDAALSRGFMVVDNSLTDSLFNSNRVLVSETLMMMKEHIVDTYGEIKYTMGNGCSGGSIQQNTAASIFPGLLDGIQPSCDYPDSITTGLEVTDCVLLVNFYAGQEWTALMSRLNQTQINAKKTAINGHLDHRGCHSWNNSFGFNNKPGNYVPRVVIDDAGTMGTPDQLVPKQSAAPRNNCRLPAALVYPNGTRCGDPDLATAVWGTTAGLTPGSTRARQTGDNVGIQYGLKALRDLAITPEEFVTLNEKIGGVDADSNLRAARSTADLPALDIAYRAGIVSSGKNLGMLPIIDSRGWDEQGIHYIWRSFSERARIDAANGGNHGNQVMWRYSTALVPPAAVFLESLLTMDTWLSNLLVSAPKATLNAVRTQAQVIDAKPTTGNHVAFDQCYLAGDFSHPHTDIPDCEKQDPKLIKHASPRQVAGGPLAENILKCQLKPLDAAEYAPVTLTAPQLTRLHAVFPDGVCDWSLPGVGQQEALSPLTFADGPGGHPLPPAPVQGP